MSLLPKERRAMLVLELINVSKQVLKYAVGSGSLVAFSYWPWTHRRQNFIVSRI